MSLTVKDLIETYDQLKKGPLECGSQIHEIWVSLENVDKITGLPTPSVPHNPASERRNILIVPRAMWMNMGWAFIKQERNENPLLEMGLAGIPVKMVP